MTFDWMPDVVADGFLAFGNLRPQEILYKIDDEPLLFTSSTRRDLLVLCYKTDSDESLSQYIVSPTNSAIIDRMRSGNISLRSALSQPWLWVAEVDDDNFDVRATWTSNPNNIPDTILPKPGRSLFHAGSIIVERTVVRDKEAYLSVKFRGGDIRNGTIPFWVIKNALDEVYHSLWGIFAPSIKRATKNVNDKVMRRIVNIPTHEMAHASLLIEIERPEIDLSAIRSNNSPDINIDGAMSNIDQAHKAFLNSTQIIRDAMQRGRVNEQLAETTLDAMEVVAPIIPRRNSFFEAVEINGRHPEKVIRPLIINAEQGNMIREIYEGARSALRTIEGEIFLVNSRSFQFTMTAGVRAITCVATTDEQRARIATLQSGDWAVVRGYLKTRTQRDLMQIQTLTVDGLTTA